MNSGDLNTQFRASMRVAAQFALVIGNAVSPPAGFIVSSLFNLAGLLNPWSSPAGQTLDDLLNDAITQGFIQFQDQLLTDELNRVRADMRAQSRQLDDYTQLPLVEPRDALIVTARDQIYSLFNNNNDDAYKFMDVLGDNIDYFDERNSEMMGNRIVSLLQIGRQRITICRRRASLFSRLTNGENPEDVDSVNRARLDFRRAQFWNEVEVEATKSSLRRYLGPMMNPPSRTESGISRVLRAWHQIQSHDQRENLEEFMHEELGLKMPGKVLMVRNLSHNHYMEASRGACPRNLNWPGNPGYNREGRDCPWLETTPLSAGQNTRSNKLFRVYGNRVRFTLWHLSTQ